MWVLNQAEQETHALWEGWIKSSTKKTCSCAIGKHKTYPRHSLPLQRIKKPFLIHGEAKFNICDAQSQEVTVSD